MNLIFYILVFIFFIVSVSYIIVNIIITNKRIKILKDRSISNNKIETKLSSDSDYLEYGNALDDFKKEILNNYTNVELAKVFLVKKRIKNSQAKYDKTDLLKKDKKGRDKSAEVLILTNTIDSTNPNKENTDVGFASYGLWQKYKIANRIKSNHLPN